MRMKTYQEYLEMGDVAMEKHRFDGLVQDFRLMNWHMFQLNGSIFRIRCSSHNIVKHQPALAQIFEAMYRLTELARIQINHYLLDNGFRELEY